MNTLVFRTQLRETALNIDSMLSLGVDDTLFTLTPVSYTHLDVYKRQTLSLLPMS